MQDPQVQRLFLRRQAWSKKTYEDSARVITICEFSVQDANLLTIQVGMGAILQYSEHAEHRIPNMTIRLDR